MIAPEDCVMDNSELFESTRKRHRECDPNSGCPPYNCGTCHYCREPYPCEPARLLQEGEKIQARAERLAGYVRHTDGTWGDGTVCNWAMPGRYKGMPCTCGLTAALGRAAGEGDSDD